jgi:thioesterase domain-containing protein
VNTPERLREIEHFLHTHIPLTRAMEVRVESCDGDALILTAPIGANHNHLGTAFGGSLAALAMLAGYSLLWLELDDRAVQIVISESQLRFRRPVSGMIRAVCRRPDFASLTGFKNQLAAKGKAQLRLEITIETKGETAVAFTGTYVAKR